MQRRHDAAESARAVFKRTIRWQHFNALLSAFAWLSVLGSLCFGHYLLRIHGSSVAAHQQASALFEHFNQTSDSLTQLVAVANDVFESQNVDEASGRLVVAMREFRALRGRSQQLSKQEPDLLLRRQLTSCFDTMQAHAEHIAKDTRHIFESLLNHDSTAAAERLLILNRRFAMAMNFDSSMRQRIRARQRAQLAGESNHMRVMAKYEMLIAISALVLIVAGTVLGWSLSRKMLVGESNIRAQNESLQHYTQQLEAAQTTLRIQADELEERTELLKVANREAAEADRAKSEFLANMSHEMRTPMTAILGFAELLLARMQSDDNLDAVRTIHRNGNHLLRMINDVLDLSRLESGSLSVEYAHCTPRRLVVETVELLRAQAESKGLAMEVSFSPDLPTTIVTDELRLRQILTNLIANAIKFTRAGQVHLHVSADPANEADQQYPALHIAIADTGIGISESQLIKIFQPFTQADGSSSRRYGGTGLGLAISQRLIRLLDGKLSVTSRLGEGSTFVVSLPLRAAESMITTSDDGAAQQAIIQRLPESTVMVLGETSAAAAPPLIDARVLLVEDGPDNQRLISHILRKAGANVTLADNGAMALACVAAAEGQGQSFDLIVMDMQMPVMDGYEAARQLKVSGFSRPIIALTAHAMAGDHEKCLAAGCDAYATKPIQRDQLLAILTELLHESAATK